MEKKDEIGLMAEGSSRRGRTSGSGTATTQLDRISFLAGGSEGE